MVIDTEYIMHDDDWKTMEENPDKLKVVRTLFLNILNEQYWNQIHNKMLIDEGKLTMSRIHLQTLDTGHRTY